MKISLVSDLHLEFDYQPLPGGEVLILAGDIAEERSLSRDMAKEEPPEQFRFNGAMRFKDFFWRECAKYQKVFYVMGNHEHYHGSFHKTLENLRRAMPPNVTILENEFEEYQGVVFLGATLWTDLNKNDPLTVVALKESMNDYRTITNKYPGDVYHKLTPEFTAGEHRRTKEFFHKVLEENKDKEVVVITHHAPSFQSVAEHFRHEKLMNGGFASEMSDFVLDHPNILYWVHGHMHDPVDYYIGRTQVLSNPRGYSGYENTAGFNPGFSFEVCSWG